MVTNQSDICRFKNKTASRWRQVLMSQSSLHSITKQNPVVMNGLLITDSPIRSEPQIRSLMKHRCMLLGDAHQMIRISMELISLQNRLHLKCKMFI